MPQISSNFILRSKQSNFERDSFGSWEEMIAVNSNHMDEGHISFLREGNENHPTGHYVFISKNGQTDLIGEARWIPLEKYISSSEDKHVISVSSIEHLSDDLSNKLPTGAIVYVIDIEKFYYNAYDHSLSQQTIDYIECDLEEHGVESTPPEGKGWFRSLLPDMTDYITIESAGDKFASKEEVANLTTLEKVQETIDASINDFAEDRLKTIFGIEESQGGEGAPERQSIVDYLDSKYGLDNIEGHIEESITGYVGNVPTIESQTLTVLDYVDYIYAEKDELNDKLSGYATTESLDAKLSDYATTESLDAKLSDYATTESLDTKLSGYVTSGSVDSKLQDYVTTDSLDATIESLDAKLSDYATTESLDAKLSDYATTESLDATIESLESLDAKLSDYATTESLDAKLSDYATTESLDAKLSDYVTLGSVDSKLQDYVTTDSLDTKLSDYATKEDLNNIEGLDLTEITNKVDSLESQVTTISAATGSIQQSLNNYKEEVANKYTSSEDLEKNYVKGDTFQQNVAFTTSKISNIEDEIESIKTGVSDIEKDYVLEADFTEVTDAIKTDLDLFKEEVENTYIKPEEVANKLNNYAPSVEHENRWIGSEFAGDLAGKTGLEVANAAYSYSAVLDQMLFHKYTPTVSQPEVNIELKEDWCGEGKINWYDEKNRIILVKAGSTGPDGGDFIPTNAKDAIISYPKGIDLANNFTNGLIPSTDEQQTSIGFCRIKDETGNWVYYRKENNIYHVPSIFEVGEYRYYMAAYFKKGSPAVNNDGMTVAEWNENDAVESKDYITIIASKPTLYNTPDGFVENSLALWGDDTTDYMELAPSCQLDQAFKTPRKLKGLYIWNDVAGDYAKVPMVFEKDDEGLPTDNLIPLYFAESIDENDYYTYIYDSSSNGHRGAIKIKVVF